MSSENESRIVELYQSVRECMALASELEINELTPLFRYASDVVSGHYHALGHSPSEEVQSIGWDENEWPAASAVLLEMKAMIMKLEKTCTTATRQPALTDQPPRELALPD